MCVNRYGNLTVDVVDAIEAEVRQRVANQDSFTALEISRAVQAKGVKERHRDMKNVVHGMFEDGEMPGYDRTLCTLPTGEQPFLYHPAVLRSLNSFGTARNGAGSGVTVTNRNVLRPGDSLVRVLYGNRLRLPAPLLRAAGFQPGDTVYVEQEGGKAALYTTPGNAPILRRRHTYKIGPDNSLRLPLRGGQSGQYVVVFRNHGVVEIAPQ